MKLSDKLALGALVMLLVTAATFVAGALTQSVRLCGASIGFLLFAAAFFSEYLVYAGKGR